MATHEDKIRDAVRARYGEIAQGKTSSCCGGSKCESTNPTVSSTNAEKLGYHQSELKGLPEGANLGLGCGNPGAIASLKPGEVVLDLGSGAGIDCFLSAKQVGSTGHVIGVDMTPAMISKARQNAEKGNFPQVEFRLGEIEHIPAADNSVDVIISNCVINLSPDKPQVLKESFRVLKSGGRLAISDVVASAVMPEQMKKDLALFTGCMAGAMLIPELEALLTSTGFQNVRIEPKASSHAFIHEWAPDRKIEDYVVSASITASKP